MDEVLRRALAPVLRDLGNSGIAAPRIEDDDWSDDPGQLSAMMWSRQGNGAGVSVLPSEPECERTASAADQVQDWVIEERWGREPTNWPRCPRHPDTHPMTATGRGEVAVWACPTGGVAVCRIGELATPSEPAVVG